MCGILVHFSYSQHGPAVDRAAVIRARDTMKRRGPDGAGVWWSEDGRVALAHRRLSIIDLSDTGAQPMFSPDSNFGIVYNGEIYNYKALRADLEQKGYHFRSTSDTEVLLHLYRDKGIRMVEQLRGMFAFAIWDGERRGVLLARDAFGVKPLYYADDGVAIRAGSQVKALLAMGDIAHVPEPAGHVGFFLWGSVPEPYTLYKGVRALPAGHTLWVDSDGHKETRRFCDLPRELAATERGAQSNSGSRQEQMRAALVDTVRHHLVADVPVGVFLSSGLDSATLAALSAELGTGDLQSLTLGFAEYRGTDKDEVPLAELVARTYGTRQFTDWVSEVDFEAELPNLFAAMDQPSVDGVNSYFVSKAAAAAGWKVALSGLGGDELFGGYDNFTQIPHMVNLLAFTRFMPGLGRLFRMVSSVGMKYFTSPKFSGIFEYGGTVPGAYLLRRGLYMPWELPRLLDPELVREGWREIQPLVRLEELIAGVHTHRAQISALEMSWYMRNQLLRDADWASMAHSVEVRVPLVDIQLLRNLAPLLSSSPQLSKLDLASTPQKALPGAILNRSKTGFNVPIRQWLLRGHTPTPDDRGLRSWARKVYAESWAG